MENNMTANRTDTCLPESYPACRKPWVAPALIASDVQDTANNQLPTFIESTSPTDRPS
jgi:hypothetical protein